MRQVLLTIDTEGPRGTDPIRYQIWGDVNGEYYGIPKIIDCCEKHGIRALFFVDIPEIWDCGYDKVKEVILYIRERGQDVGVHIHPHHMPNETRQFLYEYTKEEQRKIIADCTDAYKRITGESPLSFRAGKYGANMETLEILQELGYRYDFSEFYSNKWCGINPEVAYVLPQKVWEIVEFPVTIFKSLDISKLYRRFDKLEITDCFGEIKHVLNLYSNDGHDGVIILFLHSFSFLNFLDTPDAPTVNFSNLKTFERVLEYISLSTGLTYISESDLGKFNPIEKDLPENIVTTKGIFRQIWYSYIRISSIRKTNRKAGLLVYGGWIILFIIVLLFFFLL